MLHASEMLFLVLRIVSRYTLVNPSKVSLYLKSASALGRVHSKRKLGLCSTLAQYRLNLRFGGFCDLCECWDSVFAHKIVCRVLVPSVLRCLPVSVGDSVSYDRKVICNTFCRFASDLSQFICARLYPDFCCFVFVDYSTGFDIWFGFRRMLESVVHAKTRIHLGRKKELTQSICVTNYQYILASSSQILLTL